MYSNDSSYYYIYQQPTDEREEAAIRRAMDICPQSCIKDAGESV
jgi:ferredoxin